MQSRQLFRIPCSDSWSGFRRGMIIASFTCFALAALGLVLHDLPFAANMDALHNVCFDSDDHFPSGEAYVLAVAIVGALVAEHVHILEGVTLLSSGLSPPAC